MDSSSSSHLTDDASQPGLLGRVVSVNVGEAREVTWHGRTVTTGIWKEPVHGRRRLDGVSVDGDEQADLRVHGGVSKAVYAYASEDYDWWAAELGQALPPATFGENLTLEGIDPSAAIVGERWHVGTAVLRVTEPRLPCFKLGIRMGDASFVDRFEEAGRTGTYMAIDEPGEVGAGDAVKLLDRPGHAFSVGMIVGAYRGAVELVPRMVALEQLSESWRTWAERSLARQGREST